MFTSVCMLFVDHFKCLTQSPNEYAVYKCISMIEIFTCTLSATIIILTGLPALAVAFTARGPHASSTIGSHFFFLHRGPEIPAPITSLMEIAQPIISLMDIDQPIISLIYFTQPIISLIDITHPITSLIEIPQPITRFLTKS